MNAKAIIATAIIAVVATFNVAAQGKNTIAIKATKASKALVEQWVNAYKAVNPEAKFTFVDKKEEATLSITTSPESAAASSVGVTIVGRFAVLPVTSKSNPLYKEVTSKQWSEKDIKSLFFLSEDDVIDELGSGSKKEKLADKLTVFSGNNSTSAAPLFAHHFGYDKSDIRGKRIQGDDLYLLNAIQKENQSVTFNNIAYLYDTNSRQLKQDIAILPLNIKKDQEQTLLSGNLDETLALLENTTISTIPVEDIAFAYSSFNSDIEKFLYWVVNEGQQYNNKAGYLQLNEKNQKQQLALLSQR